MFMCPILTGLKKEKNVSHLPLIAYWLFSQGSSL